MQAEMLAVNKNLRLDFEALVLDLISQYHELLVNPIDLSIAIEIRQTIKKLSFMLPAQLHEIINMNLNLCIKPLTSSEREAIILKINSLIESFDRSALRLVQSDLQILSLSPLPEMIPGIKEELGHVYNNISQDHQEQVHSVYEVARFIEVKFKSARTLCPIAQNKQSFFAKIKFAAEKKPSPCHVNVLI